MKASHTCLRSILGRLLWGDWLMSQHSWIATRKGLVLYAPDARCRQVAGNSFEAGT